MDKIMNFMKQLVPMGPPRAMWDHVGVPVSDYGKSREFYLKALKPLNCGLVKTITEGEGCCGIGPPGMPAFWLFPGKPEKSAPLHLCFAAPNRPAVDAFYAAALEAGGKDNGPPGLRPQYHANYYGAFIIDPDGNNIEACCHCPA